jgi:hypothetical protein
VRPLRLVAPAGGVDALVVVVVAVALGGAALYARSAASPARAVRALEDAVTVSLPAGWTHDEVDGVLVAQRPSLGEVTPTLEVRRLDAPPDGSAEWVELALASIERERAETGFGYRVLHTERRRAFGGHQSWLVRYAIVRDPPDSEPGDAVIPVVIEGVDILVHPRGRTAYHISAWDREEHFGREDAELASTLASVEVAP